MLEEEMKVGPKGQVVIPRVFRKALNISPGSKVLLRLESDHLILQNRKMDAATEFEKIARSGKSISKYNSHAYEKELQKRVRLAP